MCNYQKIPISRKLIKPPKYTDQKKTKVPKVTTSDGAKGVNLTSLNELVRIYKQVRNKMIKRLTV